MLYTVTTPPHTTITPTTSRVPALSRLCDQMKAAYWTCKRNGDDAGAMNAYIRLHEIEDDY